jgi:hypothetical protein
MYLFLSGRNRDEIYKYFRACSKVIVGICFMKKKKTEAENLVTLSL